MKWRKLNNILHRDIGYLIVGLTIVYAISGVAVNHIEDWNPNTHIEKEVREIEPITSLEQAEMVKEAITKLHITDSLYDSFRPDEATLLLFFEQQTYSIDLPTGNVIYEKIQPRRVLYEMNQLHLNSPKGVWTYIADVYALSLLLVAITGLFVLKGKTGITGRGAWLTSIGIAVPLLYWLYYLYWT